MIRRQRAVTARRPARRTRHGQLARRPHLESLEDRRLLSVTILEETFKSLPYTVAGSFSGTTVVPSAGYQDNYSGTTSDSGTMTYTSATQGQGPISISGSGSGSDNFTCPSYTFSFDAHGKLADNDGLLSRFDVAFDRYDSVGCDSGGPSQFDRDLSGTFRTSDFQATLDWSIGIPNGTSSGDWSGLIEFQGDSFDARPTAASFVGSNVELEFAVTGQPVHAATHTTPVTDVQLFWATGPTAADIVGGRIGEPVPIYWNQAGGRARVTDLAAPPAGATHLLVITDRDQLVSEADESNNVLAVGSDIALTALTWNTQRGASVTSPQRGVDFSYQIVGAGLANGADLSFYWASGSTFADRLGTPLRTIALEQTPGAHSANEPARWGTPAAGTTHILVVADPDGQVSETDETNNVLALPLHSAAEILTGAIVFSQDDYLGTNPEIEVTFEPGNGMYTMSEAEVALGVDHFNWLQYLTSVPPSWTLEVDYGDPVREELSFPAPDPITNGGNQDHVLISAPDFRGQLSSLAVDDALFYFDEGQEIAAYTESGFLKFVDSPRKPAEFLPIGDATAFRTSLVGVDQAGRPIPLPITNRVSNTFRWKTNAVYDNSGAVDDVTVWLKAIDDGTLPPVTTGGVFDLATLDDAPPTATADRVTTPESTHVVIDILANDVDADDILDPTSVAITTDPSHGTASLDAATGQITYLPADDFIGYDVIEYTVDNDQGTTSNAARVTVHVTSTLGIARHSFSARVTEVWDDIGELGNLQINEVVSGTIVYDTSIPFDAVAHRGADLQLNVGNVSFPPTDIFLANGDPLNDNLGLTFVQDSNAILTLEAAFFLTGDLATNRLPKCLTGMDGSFDLSAFNDTTSPYGFQATIESLVCILGPPWQNPEDPLNVDGDANDLIVPLDALLVINRINTFGSGPLPDPPVPPDVPPPYVDVSGDGRLAPIDALLVINYLNNRFGPQGESNFGEAADLSGNLDHASTSHSWQAQAFRAPVFAGRSTLEGLAQRPVRDRGGNKAPAYADMALPEYLATRARAVLEGSASRVPHQSAQDTREITAGESFAAIHDMALEDLLDQDEELLGTLGPGEQLELW